MDGRARYGATCGEPELARPLIDRAITLNPNSPNGWWVSGTVRNNLGEYAVSLEHLARARRLSPLEPLAFAHWASTAVGYFFAGRYEEALEATERSLSERGDFPPALRIKIACCGLLGRIDEGRECLERLVRVNPGTTMATLKAYYEPLTRHHPRSFETYLKGFRLCGLPEGNSQ